ncbi:hypothetical protein CASFOL_009378 [Castilleja foliolosa]|uniref:Uncharacterized protein n=1 Tax=Castilleja foliolosa TaxID=1961234 RepID=A0ABD3E153_9LAMI
MKGHSIYESIGEPVTRPTAAMNELFAANKLDLFFFFSRWWLDPADLGPGCRWWLNLADLGG